MARRYAVIGTGMMGQEHIRNISLLDDAEVAAVVDTDAVMRSQGAQMAIDFGSPNVKSFTTLDELTEAGGIDAYVVVTPNDTHARVMDRLLATNKPILLEKPAATTPQEAWAMVEIARARLAPVWVGMEYRFMPAVARLVDEVEAGAAGQPHMVSIVEHRFPFLDKVEFWNRSYDRTGGTMVEKCCHFFDLMRHLTGSEPTRLYASGAQSVNFVDDLKNPRHKPVVDNAFVVVDFENGMRSSLDLCMFAEGSWWQEQVSVTGDKAKLVASVPGPARFNPDADPRHSHFGVYPRRGENRTEEELAINQDLMNAGDHHGSTYFQHLAFAEMIQTQSQPAVSLDDGAMAVEMGAAAETAIAEKRLVEISARPTVLKGAA
ncbi:MAG: Gfo/Idh/MocA family oxidoreductase [Pseudomonadota bacterium]